MPIQQIAEPIPQGSEGASNPESGDARRSTMYSSDQLVRVLNGLQISLYQHQLDSAHKMHDQNPNYPMPDVPKLWRMQYDYPFAVVQDLTWTPPADPLTAPHAAFTGSPIGVYFKRNPGSDNKPKDFYVDASLYKGESQFKKGDIWRGAGPGIGPYQHDSEEFESPWSDKPNHIEHWHLWEDLGS